MSPIDIAMLEKQSAELAKRIADIEQRAWDEAGQPFNLGSPKQIQEILFDKLQLPVMTKTPKGAAVDGRVGARGTGA